MYSASFARGCDGNYTAALSETWLKQLSLYPASCQTLGNDRARKPNSLPRFLAVRSRGLFDFLRRIPVNGCIILRLSEVMYAIKNCHVVVALALNFLICGSAR